MKAAVFVEGGGNSNRALSAECRQAFALFLSKAGLSQRLPQIVVSGPRKSAYDDFLIGIRSGKYDLAVLLVDSEGPVEEDHSCHEHLRKRQADQWKLDDSHHVFLMVQTMETWLLSDAEALRSHFNPERIPSSFPKDNAKLEAVSKDALIKHLDDLGKQAKAKNKTGYEKGVDSFKLLAAIDPAKVEARCPHAKEFLEFLRAHLK